MKCTSKSAHPPTERIPSPRAYTSLGCPDAPNPEVCSQGVCARQKSYARPRSTARGAAHAPTRGVVCAPQRGTQGALCTRPQGCAVHAPARGAACTCKGDPARFASCMLPLYTPYSASYFMLCSTFALHGRGYLPKSIKSFSKTSKGWKKRRKKRQKDRQRIEKSREVFFVFPRGWYKWSFYVLGSPTAYNHNTPLLP